MVKPMRGDHVPDQFGAREAATRLAEQQLQRVHRTPTRRLRSCQRAKLSYD
jgi:hypothetical protein